MITLAIVGDIFLSEALPDDVINGTVLAMVQQANIAFGNLEAPVSTRGTPVEKWINMWMLPERLDDLKNAGFDILTLANNHMMDYGLDAFFDTQQHLSDCEIPYVGVGGNIDEAWQPTIIESAGQRIAFLAGCSTLGPQMAAGEHRPGVAPIHVSESYHVDSAVSMEQPGSAPYVHTKAWAEDVERAKKAIQDAKQQADFVVMAMHWGVPPLWRSRFQDGLADYQIQVGHALVDAGANLIVGHHPHSLQAVEVYDGVPIFYSLGNFIFHENRLNLSASNVARNVPYQLTGKLRNRIWAESIILDVQVEADTVTCTLHPVLLDKAGNPYALTGHEAQTVIQRLADMSPDATLQFYDGIGKLAV